MARENSIPEVAAVCGGCRIIRLPEVGSTNAWLKEYGAELPDATVVVADAQTAGRGQRGNSWEAAPGMNLTFSMLLRPRNVRPEQQFAISEAVALGVATVLRDVVSAGVAVKWPNDIYVGDRKICGILIEHSIAGPDRIERTIAGIGLNVNQREFLSDAPNPVSLFQLIGRETLLRPLLERVCCRIMSYVNRVESGESLADEYRRMLWRGEGYHWFSTPSGERFEAMIADIHPCGVMELELRGSGQRRTFAFKEVVFITEKMPVDIFLGAGGSRS